MPASSLESSVKNQAASESREMINTVVVGWIISFLGSAIWIYGYYVNGSPPLVDWDAYAPWWISMFLPNLESEIGAILVFVSMFLTWPRAK